MYITFSNNQFIENPLVNTCIDDSFFIEKNIRYYDNDGFKPNLLEQEYYRAQGIALEDCLGFLGARYPWASIHNMPNFILDHSMVLTRCGYTGQALEQLEYHSQTFPYLKKYLQARPKWGLDFALEYVDEDGYLEILHIERDFADLNQAKLTKTDFEKRLANTNWFNFVKKIKATKQHWQQLEGIHRNDWKAQEWGGVSAENILKAFE